MTRVVVLVFFLLFLTACQPKKNPWIHQSKAQAGPDLTTHIDFLEDRIKQRPKAYLEMAELAGYYLQRGRARRSEEDLEASQKWVEKSLAEFDNSAARLVKADALQMKHFFAEAQAELQAVLDREPGNLSAQALWIRVALSRGDIQSAQEMVDRLPDSPLSSLAFLRAQAAEASGKVEEARQLYGRSLLTDIESQSKAEAARRRAIFARMEIEAGNLSEADQLLEAANTIPVEQPLTQVLRADLLRRNKDYAAAEELLRAAFEQFRDATFLIRLGEVEQEAGKAEAAEKTFQTAVKVLRQDNLGHERDLALLLHYLDADANKAEIEELMKAELERRKDKETLRIAKLVGVGL